MEPQSVSIENCHPFKHGRWTFMHNGGIPRFSKIKLSLLNLLTEECFQQIEGSTDSEHVFALFLSFLPDRDSFLDVSVISTTLEKTIGTILSLCKAAGVVEPCSLNICVTDGVHVLATRFRNGKDSPPSLYYNYGSHFMSTEGTFMYPGSEHSCEVVISSAPLCKDFYEEFDDTKDTPGDCGSWVLVPKNSMLVCVGDYDDNSKINEIYLSSINTRPYEAAACQQKAKGNNKAKCTVPPSNAPEPLTQTLFSSRAGGTEKSPHRRTLDGLIHTSDKQAEDGPTTLGTLQEAEDKEEEMARIGSDVSGETTCDSPPSTLHRADTATSHITESLDRQEASHTSQRRDCVQRKIYKSTLTSPLVTHRKQASTKDGFSHLFDDQSAKIGRENSFTSLSGALEKSLQRANARRKCASEYECYDIKTLPYALCTSGSTSPAMSPRSERSHSPARPTATTPLEGVSIKHGRTRKSESVCRVTGLSPTARLQLAVQALILLALAYIVVLLKSSAAAAGKGMS